VGATIYFLNNQYCCCGLVCIPTLSRYFRTAYDSQTLLWECVDPSRPFQFEITFECTQELQKGKPHLHHLHHHFSTIVPTSA
jgi:hypothetical protein